MMPRDAHFSFSRGDWRTDIDETAGKDERSTETTNLPTVINGLENTRAKRLRMRKVSIFELFFCKKIPLSRRVGYVMDGWISGSAMYACQTNKIGSTIIN